jgi:hypothetical protein
MRRIPAIGLAAMLWPASAFACPICFGAGDGPMADGLNAGIVVLLGVTVFVLGGFAVGMIGFARRARRYAEREQA